MAQLIFILCLILFGIIISTVLVWIWFKMNDIWELKTVPEPEWNQAWSPNPKTEDLRSLPDSISQTDEDKNNDLKTKFANLQTKNEQIAEAHQKLEKDTTLQRENELKWEATEAQLRQQIVDLKNVVANQKDVLSSLESVNENLQTQLATMDKLLPELVQYDTFNRDAKYDELKQQARESRKKLKDLQNENRKMWEIREGTLKSAQKAKILSDEQLAALAEALAALQQIVPLAKQGAADAEMKAGDIGDEFKPSYAGGNWINKWLKKKQTFQHPSRDKLEFIKLLQNTGCLICERAINLQQLAENLKVKGNDLKKKAKKLSKVP